MSKGTAMTYNNPQPQSDPNQPTNGQSGNGQQPSQQQPVQPAQPQQQMPPQPAQPAQPTYGQYAPQSGYQQPAYGQYSQYSQQQPGYPPFEQAQADSRTSPNPYAAQPGYTQPGYTQPGYTQPGYQQPGYQQSAPGTPLPQGNPYYNYAAGGTPPINQPWYGIGFGDAVKRLFAKPFTVKGRASRGEFWWTVLFLVLCSVGVDLITFLLGAPGQVIAGIWSIFADILLVIIGIRRLHDTNRSGWFMLIPAAPAAISTIMTYTVGLRFLDDLQLLASTVTNMQSEYEIERLAEMFFASHAETIAMILGVSLAAFVGYVIGIVLLAGRTKPAGARFDA